MLLIEPLQPSGASGGFKVTVQRAEAAEPELLYARKVVLATGIQGGGEWWVPGGVVLWQDGLVWKLLCAPLDCAGSDPQQYVQ